MKNNNAAGISFWNTTGAHKKQIICYYPQRLLGVIAQCDLIVLHLYLVFREFYCSEIVVSYTLFKNKGTLCSNCPRGISISRYSKVKPDMFSFSLYEYQLQRF